MNVEIICIGALKEAYLKDAEREYLKRLAPYAKVSVAELREARLPKNAGAAEEEIVRESEGNALLAALEKRGKGAFVFALDMRGGQMRSEEFAEVFREKTLAGTSAFIFLIGGSLGLPGAARQNADAVLSLSEMTFPHQLARVILLEQIYRAQKILRGEIYHK